MLKKLAKDLTDMTVLVKLVVGVSVVSAVTAYTAKGYIESTRDQFVGQVKQEIMKDLNKPAYTIVEFDLLKQLEKLTKDPDDIKFTDVRKFVKFCEKDEYFKNVYIPASKESRALEIACGKIIDKFDEAYNQ